MKHCSPENTLSRGFTIVEMAIVVVVIAMLIGGVMAGKAMISGGKVRAVLGELEENRASMEMFHEKYFDWPGDMVNASEMWPGAANGNGNERIEWSSGEGTLAWYHLMMADMTGQRGFSNDRSTVAVVGGNVPSSKIAGGGWFMNYTDTMQNHIGLGGQIAGTMNGAAILPGKRAYDIDMKLDDGNPAGGKVQSSGTDCVDGGLYTTMDEKNNCMMMFSME